MSDRPLTAHGPLLHVVLIRLADPAEAPELIAACRERLARIPSVVGLQVGAPTDIGRDGVDLDFDVGLLVSFVGRRGYLDYLEHPEHVALVAAWKPRWDAIVIHDLTAEPALTAGSGASDAPERGAAR